MLFLMVLSLENFGTSSPNMAGPGPALAGFGPAVSSRIPNMCHILVGLCLSPFSWPMTKPIQERTYAKHAG